MPSAKRFPRLDQLFSSLGYGSRREAQQFLDAGRLVVDGQKLRKPDVRVDPASVQIDGEALDHPEGLLVMLHKPVGYVCSHEEREGPSVYELLPARWLARSPRLEGVGRLDKDTSGLYLLTDQHDLVHALTSPKRHVDKIYEATWSGELPNNAVELFASGELLLKGEAKPCLAATLTLLGTQRGQLKIREGRFHQVRRMFATVGVQVSQLHRQSLGALSLGDLPVGEYRHLPLNYFASAAPPAPPTAP